MTSVLILIKNGDKRGGPLSELICYQYIKDVLCEDDPILNDLKQFVYVCLIETLPVSLGLVKYQC